MRLYILQAGIDINPVLYLIQIVYISHTFSVIAGLASYTHMLNTTNQTKSIVTFHDLLQTPLELAVPHLSIHVYQQVEQMSGKTKYNKQIIVNLNPSSLAEVSVSQSQRSE